MPAAERASNLWNAVSSRVATEESIPKLSSSTSQASIRTAVESSLAATELRRPNMKVCGREVVTRGRFVKIASLDGEKYLILDDPKSAIEELRSSGVRADLFTFLQRLPDKSPKFDFPFEMDNLAAMPITSFDDWWNKQIRSYARNRAR